MKLWHLMEAECHQLDLELAMVTTGETGDRDGFLAHSRRDQCPGGRKRTDNAVRQCLRWDLHSHGSSVWRGEWWSAS